MDHAEGVEQARDKLLSVAAAHHVSCEMHKQYSNVEGMELAVIDPDGSGPLPPFEVGCDRGQHKF